MVTKIADLTAITKIQSWHLIHKAFESDIMQVLAVLTQSFQIFESIVMNLVVFRLKHSKRDCSTSKVNLQKDVKVSLMQFSIS